MARSNFDKKRLECLYGLRRIRDKGNILSDESCREAVNLLPTAWQYPQLTCARISLSDQKFETTNFKKTKWRQFSNIKVRGIKFGTVEIYYTRDMPKSGKSPFLTGEKKFLDTFTSTLGEMIQYMLAHQTPGKRAGFPPKLLRDSPSPIVVINADRSIEYVSKSFEKLTGFASSEVTGKKPPYPWWPDDSFDKVTQWFEEAIIKNTENREECFRKKDGTCFWVHIDSAPVKKDGKLMYYLSNCNDITEQKRLNENLQFYAKDITESQEKERKRIAHELHDTTIQNLLSLYSDIHTITENPSLSTKIAQILDRIRADIGNIVEEVRQYSHGLRPGLLDNLGLIPALQHLVEETVLRSDLNCHIKVTGSRERLSPETELAMFRVTQEALQNTIKHAEATKAMIVIKFAGRGGVLLTIDDNGNGFQIPPSISDFARMDRLGILGMLERVHMIGGTLAIVSNPRKGTRVIAHVPEQTRQ